MTGVEHEPVLAGGFSLMLLYIPCLRKNPLGQNCKHLSADYFRGIFVAEDEASLSYGEDEKAKSAKKS